MKLQPIPAVIPLRTPLLRGKRRLRIVLVGMPNAGKRTLFNAVSSTSPQSGTLAGTQRAYSECSVQIGFDEASLFLLPSVHSSRDLPLNAPASFAPPDAIIQVVDAAHLESHIELALELAELGRPMVIALNRMDEAAEQGLYINVKELGARLGVPVVPTVALLGQGVAQLFAAAVNAVRDEIRPLPHPPRAAARSMEEQLHADRHLRAAALFEASTRFGASHAGRDWRYWLDELLAHPRWGLVGSLAVFAAVLFVVFKVGAWLDAMTAGRLVDALSGWQPDSTAGIVGRAVTDGLLGLTGIVVPYMIPLVLLLVALEEAGVMQRIAFVVDRGFHQIGLHGGVAVPFLTGLGCNVPALSAVAKVTGGRERVIASVLITFVPCSARSAIILALAGKYLGGAGVFGIFALTLVVIALMGRLMARRQRELGPGQVQEIPPFALPRGRVMIAETWERTRDILTIVTPLLVGGSVVLALMTHFGADTAVNAVLTPVTSWWLGLPVVLGVPILFGILRKELSLLMIFQALGTAEIGALLEWVQITTFLLFLAFYIPCISTFAVMLKTVGRREALYSVSLSVAAALLVSCAARLLLEGARLL